MAIAEVTDPGLLFRYSDAHEFTTKSGLCRKAGVKEEDLLKIVAKELTDNALDAVEKAGVTADTVRVGLLPGNGFFVQDGAGGFSRDGVLEFWRVDRGYTSSKRLRLPTRGALGNGLRVVAGAVIAFGAALTVHTQGIRYRLELRAEGGPVILEEAESSYQGTRIEISFPDDPLDEEILEWANRAVSLSSGGYFPWKTSPYWYTAQDLHEILKATADGQTVASVVAEFDGCSGAKAGMVVKGYRRVAANSLSLEDAGTILSRMREVAKPFNHRKMNKIGDETSFATGEYETTTGVAIPFSVSVWASPSRNPEVELCLNRSTFAADCWAWHNNSSQMVNLPSQDGIGVTTKKPLSFVINISSPLVPFTSDGKAPDLNGFFSCGIVQETVRKATTRAKVRLREPRAARKTQKEAVFEALPEALRIAGGGYAFSQRQVFYAIRPLLDSDLDYGYFCDVLTKYEAEFGEVENLYRDNRGSLIIPHTREEIPVGTLSVANFKRPEWTFSRILYVEKQGFFPLLKSAGWMEKWDCALISSSGYASRAVKDLIDALGSDGEPIEVFALHDADGPGTCILQSLIEATASRGARQVHIHNLGLEPWDALSMGLVPEKLERKSGAVPVADYIPEEWRAWLQCKRVELNAMTTPQFISWLDEKMEAATRSPAKLVPPDAVLKAEYEAKTRDRIKSVLAERILAEAGYSDLVEAALKDVMAKAVHGLPDLVTASLADDRGQRWQDPVKEMAIKAAESAGF